MLVTSRPLKFLGRKDTVLDREEAERAAKPREVLGGENKRDEGLF